uniref:Uncharacterized protein n=1 Tax=Panagrolaimus sp. ES5 TaxID=591445 RepID=A0AC34FC31_9BILA
MRLVSLSIFIFAVVASILSCFGQKNYSNIITRLENSRFEDFDEGKLGYYKYQSEIYAPYAKHTDILKGFALLSNDNNQFYAIPKKKDDTPTPQASVTISPRHCLKYPEQKDVTSCLCYAADFDKLSSDMSAAMELCYARNMVPICVTYLENFPDN